MQTNSEHRHATRSSPTDNETVQEHKQIETAHKPHTALLQATLRGHVARTRLCCNE